MKKRMFSSNPRNGCGKKKGCSVTIILPYMKIKNGNIRTGK